MTCRPSAAGKKHIVGGDTLVCTDSACKHIFFLPGCSAYTPSHSGTLFLFVVHVRSSPAQLAPLRFGKSLQNEKTSFGKPRPHTFVVEGASVLGWSGGGRDDNGGGGHQEDVVIQLHSDLVERSRLLLMFESSTDSRAAFITNVAVVPTWRCSSAIIFFLLSTQKFAPFCVSSTIALLLFLQWAHAFPEKAFWSEERFCIQKLALFRSTKHQEILWGCLLSKPFHSILQLHFVPARFIMSFESFRVIFGCL